MITLMCSFMLQGNIDEAVTQAFKGVKDDVEYAGAIIQEKDGSLCGTEVARGQLDHFEFRLLLRPGEKVVALYHTHTEINDDKLSWQDEQMAKKLGVLSYIRVNRTGKIVVGGRRDGVVRL